jgi:hypothetical protein
VEKVLGTGASGVVYGVTDALARSRLALKVLWERPEEGDGTLERLRREIKASQRAPHPHLLPIHDLLLAEGRPALLMEWVEGETLKERVRREGLLPTREAERIARAVLEALSHLHGLGVLHRDVKSGNVLLGADGSVKLGDFGLAKGEDLGESLTLTGMVLGTPGYMAPEVIRGGEASVRSDLYGVGVILFEMLAGHPPFQGAGSLEVASRQLAENAPLYLLKSRRVPRWLIQVAGRLLAREPSDRYDSAEAVLQALKERSAGLYFPRAWRRRAAAAVLGLTLLAGSWGGWRWWDRAAVPVVTFSGATLEVRRPSGRLLWSRTFERPITAARSGRFGPEGSPAVAVALLSDVDSPARSENADSGTIIQFFLADGCPWTQTSFAMNAIPFSNRFNLEFDSHVFRKGEPECLVVRGAHATWYPSSLKVLRTMPGRWGGPIVPQLALDIENSGHIYAWTYADLDGDGSDEVVYEAVNNRLYWGVYLGAASLRKLPSANALRVSPDVPRLRSERLLFYRCVGFDAYDSLAFTPRRSGQSAIPFRWFNRRRDLAGLVFPDGRISLGGVPLEPSPEEVEAYNERMTQCVQFRDAGRWAELLAFCEQEWPLDSPGPYGYLGRFFRASALMGMGSHGQVSRLMSRSPPPGCAGPPPDLLDHFRANAPFLAGDYRACLLVVDELLGAGHERPEIGQVGLWAALYAEDAVWRLTFLSRTPVPVFAWNRDVFPGVAAYTDGDFVSAGQAFRAGYLASVGGRVPEPGLWLADTLLRRGKVREAREVFDELTRTFPGDHLEERDVALYLRLREGREDPGVLAASMDAVVEQARTAARTEVEARALLPFTLARAAAVHRAAGDRAGARRLQAEAEHLAPRSWKPALTM